MTNSELDQRFEAKLTEVENFFVAVEWLESLIATGQIRLIDILNWWKKR